MKKYAVFGYELYYPSGGMNDFLISSDSYTKCIEYIENSKTSSYQKDIYEIWDTETMTRLNIIDMGFY